MSKRFHIHQWSSAEMKAFCHVNWKFLMAKDRDAWYPNQMLSMGLIIFSSCNLDTMPLAALSHLHSAVMHRALCVLFYSWGAFAFGSSENAEVALCSVRLLMCSDVFWALICPQESCLEFFSPLWRKVFPWWIVELHVSLVITQTLKITILGESSRNSKIQFTLW